MSKKNISVGQDGIVIPPTKEDENYNAMLNAKGTNELAKIPTSSRAITAQFTYHPEVNEGELFTSEDVKVTVKEFDNSSSLGKSILFFYNILCKYTKDISVKTNVSEIENKESREVYLDLDDFISSFGVPDRKKAVQRLKEYYETLKNITLDFEEFNPKDQTVKKYSLEIFSGKGTEQSLIKRSKNYFFILNYDLVKYLVERNYITYFPNRAFGIDVMRYPNALSVTNKLSVMYSENYWKSNKGLISLEKLLESVSDIPSFETVRQTNRHYYDRIIEPLEKTMDYLKDMKILQDWEWCNKKRSPLTDEQIQGYGYAALKECYIKYEMADYPDDIMKLRKEKIDAKKEKKVKKGANLMRKRSQPNAQKDPT